jgi:hypothetical protein
LISEIQEFYKAINSDILVLRDHKAVPENIERKMYIEIIMKSTFIALLTLLIFSVPVHADTDHRKPPDECAAAKSASECAATLKNLE